MLKRFAKWLFARTHTAEIMAVTNRAKALIGDGFNPETLADKYQCMGAMDFISDHVLPKK